MAYDEDLAGRLRQEVQGEQGVSEKRMFGGLAFLVDGNLAVSVSSKGRPSALDGPGRGRSPSVAA